MTQIWGTGRAGIGGVFCKEVSVDSAMHAKLLAFREGILIAATSHWAVSYFFLFEFNSHTVMTWVGDPLLAP